MQVLTGHVCIVTFLDGLTVARANAGWVVNAHSWQIPTSLLVFVDLHMP